MIVTESIKQFSRDSCGIQTLDQERWFGGGPRMNGMKGSLNTEGWCAGTASPENLRQIFQARLLLECRGRLTPEFTVSNGLLAEAEQVQPDPPFVYCSNGYTLVQIKLSLVKTRSRWSKQPSLPCPTSIQHWNVACSQCYRGGRGVAATSHSLT